MPLYNARGNVNVTVNDTSMPFGIYAADGSLRVKIVSGTSLVGLYAADGAYNVVSVPGTDANTGIYHPSGALRATAASGSSIGLRAPSGAIYMAGLIVVYAFTADSGTYTIQAPVNTMLYNRLLVSAGNGPYTITGTDASLTSTTVAPPALGEWDRSTEDSWARILENGDFRVVEAFSNDILSNLVVTPIAGGTTATFSADSTSTTGTFYAVVYPATATVPTAEQIEAGTDGDNNPATWSTNFVISSIDDYVVGPSGLIQTTNYKLSCTIRNTIAVGDYANVVTASFTTLDAAPILSNVSVATLGSSGGASTALFGVDTDDYTGSIKWGYFPSASTPTKSNILNGTGGALAFGSKTVSSTGRKHVIGTTGLAPSTSYKLHAYQVDGSAQESSIITSAAFNTYPNETSQFQAFHNGATTPSSLSNIVAAANQADPLGGTNAVKFTGTPTGSAIICTVAESASRVFQNGNNRFRAYIKKGAWASSGAFLRWRVTNVGADSSCSLQINLDTGAIVIADPGITLQESVKLEDGWWYYQWNANLLDSTGPIDTTGLAQFTLASLASNGTISTAGAHEIYIYDYRGTY